ncbi:uncharacterized protein [Dysidea avara]|uniref:uncharacterized protein isoform X2 n=1 Tax=Dysidea avara TaxID=196820 RepID=UPI0033211027
MASSNNSDPVSGGWLQWVYDSMCVLEHIWTTADIQLELSIYLLAGVVVLWILIGMAWWNYEEAISNLFELRSKITVFNYHQKLRNSLSGSDTHKLEYIIYCTRSL